MARMSNSTHTNTYTDDLGNTILLGKELARGGEGRVCLVDGKPDVVAKIYLDKALQKHDKAGKIKAMCDLYDQDVAKFSALPQRVIFDSHGKVVGFIMEKITDFKEIHNLYGISTKRKLFDFADWGFMVHTAKNLACAVDTLHNKNIVIGDINQGNILVNNQAMIKLIDCDSYQVEYNGQFYLCEVGVPEYTSPELQGQSFNGVHRTKNHDCFGLAVMIFKILMFGRHPYSGVGAPPEIEKAISQGYYCYGKRATGTTPIYSQLATDIFSDEVKNLFERAFAIGNNVIRPTAEEWINTLDCLEQNLVQCSNNHKYFNNGSSCIWCKLAKFGFNPFGKAVNVVKPQNKPNYQQTPYQNTYTKPSSNNSQNTTPSNNSYQYSQPQQTIQQNTPITNKFNPKPIFIILAVIFFLGMIGVFNDSNDNNYTSPTTQTTGNNAPQQKVYTDKEKQADLKAYKDSLLYNLNSRYLDYYTEDKRIHNPINNKVVEVKINKDGYVSFPNESNDVAFQVCKLTITNGYEYIESLPKSYDKDSLSLKFLFTGNEVKYADSVAVTNTKPKTSTAVQNTSSNNSMDEFYKINNTHTSSNGNNSDYGEFGSFVTDKTPQKTKEIIKQSVKQPVNKQTSKQKSNIEKSQDWFFE